MLSCPKLKGRMQLATHLHLEFRLKMSEGKTHITHMLSWHGQEQLYVSYIFKLNLLLHSVLTNDVRCMYEIKSSITMTKVPFNKKKTLFSSKIGLKFEEETGKMLHLKHGFVWCWNLDASVSRSETPGKFWNVVLKKDGEYQLDRSCEKWRSVS